MNNLLTLSYWFNQNPGPFLAQYLKIIYASFGLLFILGLVAWWFVSKNKDNKLIQKFWQKVRNVGLTIGVIGFLLIFFRQQRVQFLSMPFLMLLLLIGLVVWIYFILKYFTKTMPKRKKEQQEKIVKEKYLP